MCEIVFNIIVAILVFTFGFAYIILSLSALPPPHGFLIHWQNHKDFWAEGLDLNIPPPVLLSSPDHLTMPPSSHFLHPSAWHPASSKVAAPTTASSTPVCRNNLRIY